jgi:hypothetical protein
MEAGSRAESFVIVNGSDLGKPFVAARGRAIDWAAFGLGEPGLSTTLSKTTGKDQMAGSAR